MAGGPIEPVPDDYVPDPRRWWALFALSLAVLMVAVDVTVLAVAMPDITLALRPTAAEAIWISDIYPFILAGLLIPMGNFSDRWGRKKLLLWGSVAFGVTSVMAAFSATSNQLLVSRLVMGVAGATLMPSTLSLIRNTFLLPRERRISIGVWSAMGAAGQALGPIVGGVLLQHFWWGSIFLINVPVIVVIVAIGAFALRESKTPNPGPIDFISVALSIVGLFAVIGAIKEIAVGKIAGWSVWVILVVGIVCIVVFCRRQVRLEHPLIDVTLFKKAAFGGAVIADLLSMFALAGTLFLVAAEFQLVNGFSALQAGLYLLPATLGAMIAAPLAGVFLAKWGRRNTIAGGLFLAALGSVCYALDPKATGLVSLIGLAFVGVGAGFALTGTADSIMSTAPKDRAGAASAISETAYELGTALGIAILSTIALGYYRHVVTLPQGLAPDLTAKAQASITDAYDSLSGAGTQIAAQALDSAKDAFSSGLTISALVAAGVLIAGAIFAFIVLPKRADDTD